MSIKQDLVNLSRVLRWPIVAVALVLLVFGISVFAGAQAPAPTSGQVTQTASATSSQWKKPSGRHIDVTRNQSIRGSVWGQDQRAVPDARVCAICPTCDISISFPGHCSLTDEEGQYALDGLPTGSFAISAAAPGYLSRLANEGQPIEVAHGDAIEDLDIVLEPGPPTLAGRVLDATGGPIEGATVQVARSEYRVRPIAEVLTDKDGRFAASIDGSERVTIRASADGYASSLAFRQLPSSDVELLLTPGSTIEGRVVDANTGEGISGVDVQAAGTLAATLAPPVTSGADGRFTLIGLEPGDYQLIGEGDHARGHAHAMIRVGLTEHVNGVIIPMHRGSLVKGRILIGDSEEPCRDGFVLLGPATPMSLVHRVGHKSKPVPPTLDSVQSDSSVPT